jgi:hypothetical protein
MEPQIIELFLAELEHEILNGIQKSKIKDSNYKLKCK